MVCVWNLFVMLQMEQNLLLIICVRKTNKMHTLLPVFVSVILYSTFSVGSIHNVFATRHHINAWKMLYSACTEVTL